MSFIAAGLGAAGLALSAYGTFSKKQGVADNSAAQAAIMQQQFNRAITQIQGARDISDWYNGQSKDLADQTQANSTKTIAGADGAAFTTARADAQKTRAAEGDALINGLTPSRNYSDGAPDASGTVKSENARKLVDAFNFGKAKSAAGADINSYGDALLAGGLNINKGNQAQGSINSDQRRTDAIANLRSTLNTQEAQPVISPQDQYNMAMPVGSDAFQMGNLLTTGGKVLGAAGANGVGSGWFNGLFQGAVPGAGGGYGPQQPGIFGSLFVK